MAERDSDTKNHSTEISQVYFNAKKVCMID